MKKKRLKKSAYVLISVVVISIVGSVSYYLYNSYVTSDKYLLLEKGYTIDEVSFALTNKEIVNTLLKKDYNKNILVFMKEKYYLSKNLDKYLEYKKQNPEIDNDKIVSIINVGADSDWYVNDIKTDLNKGILMICILYSSDLFYESLSHNFKKIIVIFHSMLFHSFQHFLKIDIFRMLA